MNPRRRSSTQAARKAYTRDPEWTVKWWECHSSRFPDPISLGEATGRTSPRPWRPSTPRALGNERSPKWAAPITSRGSTSESPRSPVSPRSGSRPVGVASSEGAPGSVKRRGHAQARHQAASIGKGGRTWSSEGDNSRPGVSKDALQPSPTGSRRGPQDSRAYSRGPKRGPQPRAGRRNLHSVPSSYGSARETLNPPNHLAAVGDTFVGHSMIGSTGSGIGTPGIREGSCAALCARGSSDSTSTARRGWSSSSDRVPGGSPRFSDARLGAGSWRSTYLGTVFSRVVDGPRLVLAWPR